MERSDQSNGDEILQRPPAAASPEPEEPVALPAHPPAPPAEGRPGELRRYAITAAVAAGVLMFALAFFMGGFAAHALLEDGAGEAAMTRGDSEAVAAGAADDPSWGPQDAAVVIQEFADFQCPYCARFATQTLPRIKAAYGDTVRVVFRDFPLSSIHENAQKAAEAAQCAHEQGRFWEYHDLLFANQDALAVEDLKRYAGEVGLDRQAFDDCLDSGRNAWEVMLDVQDGTLAGVNGTPAFLVNGMLVSGAQPYDQFSTLIEAALAAAPGERAP